MIYPARLFNCAYCKCQVTICTSCDRGNIYCKQCAPLARAQSQRAAAKRYRDSRKGKLNNAKRQQAYRYRQRQKVTHHGSIDPSSNVLLLIEPRVPTAVEKITSPTIKQTSTCDFCGNCCSKFLRVNFLRSQNKQQRASSWPTGP